MSSDTHCGFVTIVGRPNVGKSTLLNHLMGEKLSITSHKPQTTRQNLYGILTKENRQAVFIDTPGIHINAKRKLNQLMNKQARQSLSEIDLVIFMVEAGVWTEEDKNVLKLLGDGKNVVCVINKVDKFKQKDELLPFMEKISSLCSFKTMVPLCAFDGNNVKALESVVFDSLPEGPFHFDEITKCSHDDPFRMKEIVREKILRTIDKEVPYCCTVDIESIKKAKTCLEVHALILVEREGQKRILIGDKGNSLKTIGIHARRDIEKLIGQKVNLKLWVKVKKGWADNPSVLMDMGLEA